MSDNKKYYYLKLKDNFFDSDTMIVLESMPDGYLYSNILMKLFLRSLKHEGKLMFNEKIPYNADILAQVTRHNVGVVEKAIKIFVNLDLIEVMDNGAIYMLDIQNYIGQSSSEADRQRVYYDKIKEARGNNLLLESKKPCKKPYKKPTPEREKELDIELKKEIDIKITEKIPYKEIITYLNEQANKNFKFTGSKTKELINGRYSDGFTIDDFIKVIDIKCEEWLGNKDMEKFLQPSTLFSISKFEGYLNQEVNLKGKKEPFKWADE